MKKQSLVLLAGFSLAIIFIHVLGMTFDLNLAPEQALGIPYNIHHDFIGLVFILGGITAVWKTKYYELGYGLIGFGLGLFVQHILTEGLILIEIIG